MRRHWKIITLAFSVFGDWLSVMSGGLSIIFAVLELFAHERHRLIFAALAYVSLWVVIIRMIIVNTRFRTPKLTVTFNPENPRCRVEDPGHIFIRALVESKSITSIQKCAGHLIRIEKDGVPVFNQDKRRLAFSPAESPDTLSKTISPGVPETLDILVIRKVGNEVGLGTSPASREVKSGVSIFYEPGNYILTVLVSGENIPTETMKLRLSWKQDYQSASFEMVT